MASTADRVLIHMLDFVNEDRLSERAAAAIDEARQFTFADYGISSVDALALMKKIEADFGVEISAEEAAKWSSLSDLTAFLDAHS